MNKRITPKERGLLKGAIRRVFSRSELRQNVVNKARIEHQDPSRPRVKKWGFCPSCQKPVALYQMQVDHILPIIPITSTLEDMSWDTVVDRTWCEEQNLQAICIDCHKLKSKEERKLRTAHKKANKK